MPQNLRILRRVLTTTTSCAALSLWGLSAHAAEQEPHALQEIKVTEGHEGDTSVSSDDLILKSATNPQNVLNSTPGVSTRQSPNQPGIEVNIRGLSGYGRVNSMIDGVPQTFKNTAGHESSGGNLLYTHPDLLAGVEIERGVVNGAHGAGTLAGAANFRTLTFSDVVKAGQNQGILARLRTGSNGFDHSGVLAIGKRFEGIWEQQGHIDVVLAYAESEESEYQTGSGRELDSSDWNRGSANTPRGALAKVEFVPNDQHRVALGYRWYENSFRNSGYGWDVDNRTWTLDYQFTPGGNLIDLTFAAYYNDTNLEYPGTGGSYAGRKTQEETSGFSITNTSLLQTGRGEDIKLNYGISWNRDDFQTHAMRGGNHPGKLDKASIFADAEFTRGRITFLGGLRYDHWSINGYRPPYSAGVADCPAGGPSCGDDWVKRNGGKLLPNIGINYQLSSEVMLSASYAHTFRPPTTHEAFYSLVPFGDGVGTGETNNINLKPEFSRTFELSAEYRDTGVFSSGDEAWLKVTAFQSRIDDYIYNDFVEIPGRSFTRAMWVNADNTTTMQGLELEGGVDTGRFYAKLNLSLSDTDTAPIGQGTAMGNGLTSAQPDKSASLDLGFRAMDGRLTLGGIVRYTGKATQAAFDWSNWPDGAYVETMDSYTLVDLYGSYELSDHATLFVSVENAFDKEYGYSGGSVSGYQELSGRGRTVVAGVTARF